jgi:hypothetical protein
MSDPAIETLRYPIGKFSAKESYTTEEAQHFISRIAALPAKVEAAIQGFTPLQLDTPYREGGWTVRQVVHHLSDSHLNAYIRLKWALTENIPIIKAYDEKAWANTPETTLDPAMSITLLTALHTKWVALMKNLGPADLIKSFYHPDSKKHVRVDQLLGLYTWHGEHHLGHILALKERMKWH